MKQLKLLLAIFLLSNWTLLWASDMYPGYGDFEVAWLSYTIMGPNEVWVKTQPRQLPPSITVPAQVTYDGVVYNVTTIAGAAFNSQYQIMNLYISEGITTIKNGSISNSRLYKINLPSTLKNIEGSNIHGCPYLQEINFPNGNDNYTVVDKKLLYTAGFDTLIVVAGGAVYNSSNPLVIDDRTHSIQSLAFRNCKKVSSVVLPPLLEKLEDCTFFGSYVDSIQVPQKVQSIEMFCFFYSDSLRYVSIPTSVKEIGEDIFTGCKNMKTVKVYWDNPNEVIVNAKAFKYMGNLSDVVLYVPAGTKSLYESAIGWRDFQNIVEDTTTFISEISDNQLIIRTSPGTIEISNTTLPVQVYSTTGQVVYTGVAAKEITIPVPQVGMYLVKMGDTTRKVIVK